MHLSTTISISISWINEMALMICNNLQVLQDKAFAILTGRLILIILMTDWNELMIS